MNPQRHAAAMDQERERLADIGVRAMRPITRAVRVAALLAYRNGHDPAMAARQHLEHSAVIVRDGMVAGHLQGRLRSLVTAARQRGEALALVAPYDAATDFLQRRLDLSDADLADLARLYGTEATTATGRLAGLLERKVGEAVAEAVRTGVHTQGGIALIRGAFDAAGVTPGSDFGLETLYRTQVQTAYGAGRWNANQDPAIDEILWGHEYVTVGDDRVRPNHAALDGHRAPKEDPVWRVIWTPNGWACRCSIVDIFHGDEQAEASPPLRPVHIDGVLTIPEPDAGWRFNPGMVYRDSLVGV